MDSIHKLKHGESANFTHNSEQFAADGQAVKVSYHRRQSQGDNGRNVPGAYTGGYTVEFPGGRTQYFDHGPHATTEGARKRGASLSAKAYAADQASQAVTSHLHAKARGFNDRR